MSRSLTSVLFVVVSTASCLGSAAAQEAPSSGWYITPQFGMYLGGSHLAEGGAPVSPETVGQAFAVEMARSPMIGVGVHRQLTSFLAVRSTLQGTLLSGPEAIIHAGTESCGTNCFRLLTDQERLGAGGVVAAAVDLALQAPIRWTVRPYAFYGFGGRHAWYDADDIPEGFSPSDATFATGHAGIGATVRFAGMEVDLEASTHRTRPSRIWPFVKGGRASDSFVSVGVRR